MLPAELEIKWYARPHQMYHFFAARKLHAEIVLVLCRLQGCVCVFLESYADSLTVTSKRSLHIIDRKGVWDRNDLDVCMAAFAC